MPDLFPGPPSQILQDGVVSQDMYLIMKGRVRVEKGDKTTPVGEGAVLNQLEPGTTFGEMSFLTAQDTCAHCIAESDVVEV